MSQKVLIVEDDSNIAELLHLYLEKEGFETKVAKDGGKGLQIMAPTFWSMPSGISSHSNSRFNKE